MSTPTDTLARTDTAVAVTDLTVRFSSKRGEVTALHDVDLQVRRGEFVSIVGPSGCGKSTLLKVVAGLTQPSRGSVELGGAPVRGPQRNIGYVFQRAALLEWRTVRKNILLQAEMRGMSKRTAESECARLIEMTGLAGFENALPHELSGGMQQRVSLCRALLHEPEVLLMDEPFGALDALTRERMNIELHRIWRETGTTVLLVTHSVAEAVYLANRVVVMSPRPGRIVELLDVDLPAHREYASTMEQPEFIRVANRIRELLGSATHAD
ncbi:ABC transporter ATP-binding protein [Nocardia sp. CA-290969]|uniref:ABC transporter ATP-binding protein n=1 Tax=Nocardia sp. CA-290969 TaxID=3239986 RepID=UPI003D94CE8F